MVAFMGGGGGSLRNSMEFSAEKVIFGQCFCVIPMVDC